MRCKRMAHCALTAVLVWAVASGSCWAAPKQEGTKPPPIPFSERKRIAVLPFDDGAISRQYWWGSDWRVGSGIADMLVTALVRTRTFRVVEREQLDKVLAEQDLARRGVVDPATAAQAGKVLGVDYLVMGKVTEFSYEVRGGAFDSFGRHWGGVSLRQAVARVALDCRMVDSSTAEIVGVFPGSGKADRYTASFRLESFGRVAFGSTEFVRSILGSATRQAVDGAAAEASKIARNPGYRPGVAPKRDGLVVDVAGRRVMTNLGARNGIRLGDRLEIVRDVREIRDPETGEVLKLVTERLAAITVSQVEEKVSSGLLGPQESAEIRVGDRVRVMDGKADEATTG